MTHSKSHQTTCHRGCSFTRSASDHPSLHPLSSPPAVSGAPGLGCPQHPRRRPRRGAAPRRRLGRCQPPSAAVSHLRRRRARRRQRLAPPRGSPPPTPTLEWKRLESAATIVAGVCEDHQDYDYDLIIPSQAGKIRKATPNWYELVVCLIKHHKTFCIRLFYTHKGLIKVAHVQDHLSKAVYPSRDNFMTSCA